MRFKTFILIAILPAITGVGANAQDVFKKDDGLFTTRDISLKQSMNGTTNVLIRSAEQLSGRLEIITSNDATISVVYRKQARTSSRSRALDFIDLISVSLNVLPDGAHLQLRAPNPPPWNNQVESGKVDVLMTVPEGCQIEIEATYFDVSASGPFKSVVIPSSLGRLEISKVTELLDVVTANRRVTLDSISGRISVTTTNSSLLARSIRSLDEQARFRNENGDIRIDGFTGSINAKNSYGRITIVDFEPRGEGNFIRGSSAPIMLWISRMTEGQLDISNRHEDIDITVPESLSAYFSLAVDNDGVIEATDLSFQTDLVRFNRLNLLTGDGAVDISGSIRGKGNIFVRGTSSDE